MVPQPSDDCDDEFQNKTTAEHQSKKKVLYGDDDTVFRGTYTILGRWESFLGFPETFSITFIPWMKTWNSTLR